MILYKFKSLEKIDYTIDIILNERLYCSLYKNLNDPFEGQFVEIIKGNSFPLKFPIVFGQKKINKTIEDICNSDEYRICSFSKNFNDIRMWSFYANSHKGIVIEIEFEDNNDKFIKIEYIDSLRKIFNENKTNLDPKSILKYKTYHWNYENEVRLIHNEQYYNISGKIKRILLGHRISELNNKIIKKIVNEKFNVIETELDKELIQVIIKERVV